MDKPFVRRIELPMPWRASRPPRRRLGRVLVISLWAHLTLLLLLVLTFRYERPSEELPPPDTVAMVFEGGKPEGPAVPKPDIPTPTSPPAPPPSPEPAPQTSVEPPPVPEPPKVAEPLPIPPSPPASPPTPAPVPSPPPPVAMALPRPVPPPRPTPPPSPAPPKAPQPAFPAPMNFSFNQPPPARPQPRGASRAPSTLDFSLAPRQGATDVTPFSRVAGAHVGPDWRNELSAWVRAHAYYPEQAAMNGEDGRATVRVVANPDGRVTSVELETKSGSVWLDLALQALFRGARLPPLRGESEPITFDFTMHYILIRVR
jgi:TonB family protein